MTFIADRIAKELKTFGVTQAAVLDISKVFYRVWHIGLFNKFKLYGIMKRIYFIVSFLSSKRLWIVLRHKLSFKCTINDKISFKINFALNEQKKKKKNVKWDCVQVLTLQNQKGADEKQRYFWKNLILKIKLQPKS